MQTIENRINELHLGDPVTFRKLTMFPLKGQGEPSIDYLTLDEALSAETAGISEVSRSGSVSGLKFLNDGDKPVFLLDGEELIGAKQNRILNLSVLVPEHAEIIIPVSCVERGRWSYNSEGMHTSNRSYFSEGRAKKARMVSASLGNGMLAMSDQSEVWHDVARKSASFRVRSDSDAMSDIFEQHSSRIDEFVDAFQQEDNQVGALFSIGDNVAGVDIFDKTSTLRHLLPKLVRSYALDALDSNFVTISDNAGKAADDFLTVVRSLETRPFPAIGMGEDVRFAGDAIAGGALLNDGAVIHLCAFPLKPEADDVSPFTRSRMARASFRRRAHS